MCNIRRIEGYMVKHNCMAHYTSNYSFQLIVGLLHKLQMALQV